MDVTVVAVSIEGVILPGLPLYNICREEQLWQGLEMLWMVTGDQQELVLSGYITGY